jgi:tRNA(Ile)-lysidine synthase
MQHQSIITLQTGKFVEVNEDVIILRNRDVFILQKRESLKYPHKMNVSIDQDELTEGFQEYFGKIFIKRGKWQGKPGRNVLELDALQLKWPIKIRNWKAGDRIRPLGMSGTKLISDVLTEHRISVVQKNEAFVLESFDGNLCAVIFPRTYKERTGIISEDVRCSSLTTTTLILSHYNS